MTAHKWGFLLGRAYFICIGTLCIIFGANLPWEVGVGIIILTWIVSPRYSDDH
jgi:hypothetical protein